MPHRREEKWRYGPTHSYPLNYMQISIPLHVPASILSGEENIHWIGGLVCLRAGLDAVFKREFLALDRNQTAVFRLAALLYCLHVISMLINKFLT
jgi:hypothetical protein